MKNKIIIGLICLLILSSCTHSVFVYTISDIIGVIIFILLALFFIVAKILDSKNEK